MVSVNGADRGRFRRMFAVHPLWAKAPLVMSRFPGLAASLVAGALLMSFAGVSNPTFLSVSESGALRTAIGHSNRFGAGFSVIHSQRFGRSGKPPFEVADTLISQATSDLPHLDDRVLTILGAATSARPASGATSSEADVRLFFRSGAQSHIEIIEGGEGQGVWVADLTADLLHVGPGDEILLPSEDASSTSSVRIKGIYESLINRPSTPYWSSLLGSILPHTPDSPLPPTFLIADKQTVVDLARRLGQRTAEFRWEFPLEETILRTSEAASLAEAFDELISDLLDRETTLGRLFSCTICSINTARVQSSTTLSGNVQDAQDAVAGLRAPVDLLSLAGLAVACVVTGSAAAYGVHRRRTEATLLFARGMGPASIGLKAALESALPVSIGALAGYGAAVLLVDRFGAGAPIDPTAIAAAARAAALTVPVALVLIAVVTATSTIREAESTSSSGRSLAAIPWELPVLLAAVFALNRILSDDSLVGQGPGGVPTSSVFLLVFPVLAIGGSAGLASRAFRRALSSLRDRGDRMPTPIYLAINRLVGARKLATLLFAASALATGILFYAETMVGSLTSTIIAKSFFATGSDLSLLFDNSYRVPSTFEFPYTTVASIDTRVTLAPSGEDIDVLAVDSERFADVAFWDTTFGPRTLTSMIDDLGTTRDDRIRAIAVGGIPDHASVVVDGTKLDLAVVERVTAFPGMSADEPTVVVDRNALRVAAESAGDGDPLERTGVFTELWVKGDPDRVRSGLQRVGFSTFDSLSAREVLEQPAFLSVSRTFVFLRALGLTAAFVVVIGLVLYIQARQRGQVISYALARRMGLRSSDHLASITMELVTLTLVSMGAGYLLGLGTAALLHSRVNPVPTLPPGPLLRLPAEILGPAAVAAVLIAGVGALVAQRAAARGDVSRELRSAR